MLNPRLPSCLHAPAAPHRQESASRAVQIKKKEGTSAFHLIILHRPHPAERSEEGGNEVQRQAARLALCSAEGPRYLAFFFSPLFVVGVFLFYSLNRGSILFAEHRGRVFYFCSYAVRATSTLSTDMCVRRDCELRSLLAVLVLAAAVAPIRGQGKNLKGVVCCTLCVCVCVFVCV